MTDTKRTLLMLGGTGFVGPAVVARAQALGYEVTVVNRGRQPPPPGVRVVRADRAAEDGLAALPDGGWDLVVDTWNGAPRAVRHAARLLAGRAERYAYVSSRSVYTWPMPAGLTEEGPVVASSPDAPATAYAEDKRGGELAAVESFGERALLLRCGLILGPREDVGRLPWWLDRVARGGPVLAPGPRELPLQLVDARDLAAFLLDAAEQSLGGAFDVVSPSGHTTMGGLLDACVEVTGSDATLRWTDPQRILDAGIAPWTQLPVWTPPGPFHDSIHRSDVAKALAAGLRCRPVTETVADTWAWLESVGGPPPPPEGLAPVGLDRATEERLLAAG
ncbi:NAD-dependent epimerase/dehydratase family protein [Streptomyces sp. 4N509B]|uniref:NAD-dependent epimerase/dehydratase family protein n=1 Tax=Streptomyces sp. 4N509B TaxID=3457413 RepID=UPI003FD3A6F6